MALTQGDSAVAAAPETSISAPSNMSSVAADNQVGVIPKSDIDRERDDKTLSSLGFAPSTDFFAPEDKEDLQPNPDVSQPARPGDNTDTKEPDTTGKEKDLSPENQKRLDDLKLAGYNGYNESDGDLADTAAALQRQADSYGTNADGSPKVNIMAYQSSDTTPVTSFYASFGNNRNDHEVNREFMDFSRRYGTPYPSGSVGYVGYVPGGNGERL